VKGSDVELPQNDSNTPKASVTHERIEIERTFPSLSRFFPFQQTTDFASSVELARLLGKSQA
jgi:hypothetical protein